MDEQSQDLELQEALRREATPETEVAKEEPVRITSALALIAAGAVAILVVIGVLVVVTPTLNPLATTPENVSGTESGTFDPLRARAEEAFQRGKTYFQQGNLDRALVELDAASVSDPDRRADIQELLNQTVEAIRKRDGQTRVPVAMPATPTAANPAPTIVPKAGYSAYRHGELGLSFLIPDGWKPSTATSAGIGQLIAEFRDGTGEARFSLARDVPGHDVSPELYAATLETRMQSLPGYSSEQVQLVNIGFLPGVKRVFRVDGKSPSGKDGALRVMQTVVGSGNQVFILTGESGVEAFDKFGATFETMTSSFRSR